MLTLNKITYLIWKNKTVTLRNIQISRKIKQQSWCNCWCLDQRAVCFPIYLSMPRTKTNLLRGDFGYPVNTDGFWEQKVLRQTREHWQSEIYGLWLNVIKTKITFVRGRLIFSSKSATTANVNLMKSLLDNCSGRKITILPRFNILPSQSGSFFRVVVSKCIF